MTTTEPLAAVEIGTDSRFNPFTLEIEAVGGRGQFGQTFDDAGNRFQCMNRVHIQHTVIAPRFLARNPNFALADTVQNVPETMVTDLIGGANQNFAARLYPISDNLTTAERNVLGAYFNFDVAASDNEIDLIGTGELADETVAVASALGIEEVAVAGLPRGASSDHASFLNEGFDALMLTTPDFEFIHTPQDTVDTIIEETLLDLALLGFATIRQSEFGGR